jgi:hypothetical protein
LSFSIVKNKVDFDRIYIELRSSLSVKYREFFDYDSVKIWFDDKIFNNQGLSPSSARNYIPCLYEFAEFVGMNPDEIVQDARGSIKNPATEYKYVNKLKEFGKSLKNDWNVMIKKLSIILSFLKSNHVKLDYDLPQRQKSRNPPFIPRKEIIRSAFLICEPNSPLRSWILAQSQCGLSEIDLLKLDVDKEVQLNPEDDSSDVIEPIRTQYSKGKCPIVITVPRQKTHVNTITFFGEEAISLLKFYDSHLFPWKIGADPGRTVRYHFEELQNILGQKRFTPHVLRKYFQTTLENGDFNPNTVKHMMGRSLGGVDSSYSGAIASKLEEKYLRVYPELRLFDPQTIDMLGVISNSDF